jgi:hypothetical protein
MHSRLQHAEKSAAQTVAQHAHRHYTTDVQGFAHPRYTHVPRVWTALKKTTSRHAFWFGTTITVDETDRVC